MRWRTLCSEANSAFRCSRRIPTLLIRLGRRSAGRRRQPRCAHVVTSWLQRRAAPCRSAVPQATTWCPAGAALHNALPRNPVAPVTRMRIGYAVHPRRARNGLAHRFAGWPPAQGQELAGENGEQDVSQPATTVRGPRGSIAPPAERCDDQHQQGVADQNRAAGRSQS